MRHLANLIMLFLLAAVLSVHVTVSLAQSSSDATNKLPDTTSAKQSPLVKVPSIPNFTDPHARYTKPDPLTIPRLKFLTTTDFPPFNFIDRKKRLSGFHVELARAICAELGVLNRCQMQALPWEELEKALKARDGEAIIAGIAIDADARKIYDFSNIYMQIPARFAIRADKPLQTPIFQGLFRKTTGVVEGSAHAAYFAKTFSEREAKPYPTREALLNALKAGEIDAAFTDAISLSFWLASQVAADCCMFIDGAYMSREHFGQGMAIAVLKGDEELVEAMNYALQNIQQKEMFSELYLKYFPLGLF